MENQEPLCIRPSIIEGESISSYLMRIAKRFKTNVSTIFEWYMYAEQRNKIRFIDFHSCESLDIQKLSNHMNKCEESIRSSTFINLINSCYDEKDTTIWGLRDSFEMNKRRFCPECIKLQCYYPLIWQVREIGICVKHNTYLEDSCPACETAIPYIADGLSEGICPRCFNHLTINSRSCIDQKELEEQQKIHEDWKYMQENSHATPFYVSDMTRGQYISAKLLYISQSFEQKLDRDRIPLNSNTTNRLTNYIKNVSMTDRKFILTLLMVRRYCRELGITAQLLYNVTVPLEFIQNISDESKKPNVTLNACGPCLAPWCTSYGNSDGMVSLSYWYSSFHKNYKRLRNPHFCKYCFLKYGFNDSGTWLEKSEMIEIAYEMLVPLINSGLSITEVGKKLGITKFKASLMVGYLIRYNLVNDIATTQFKINKSLDPIPFFKKIFEVEIKYNNISRYIKKEFHLNYLEYAYYYFDPEVQMMLLQSRIGTPHEKVPKRKKGKVHIKEEENIWETTKLTVLYHKQNLIPLKDNTWLEGIGKHKKWIQSNMPDLWQWYYDNKVEIQKSIEINLKLNVAIIAACKLYIEGKRISQELLSKECGIDRKYIRKKGIKDIIDKIIDALTNSKISQEALGSILSKKPTFDDWHRVLTNLDDF